MGGEFSTITMKGDANYWITSQSLCILWVIRHATIYLTVSQNEYDLRQLCPATDGLIADKPLTMLRNLRCISDTKIGGRETLQKCIDQEKHHIVCPNCSVVIQRNDLSLEQAPVNVYGLILDTDRCVAPGICPSDSNTPDQNGTHHGI